MKYACCALYSILYCFSAHAQKSASILDSIVEKMSWHAASTRSSSLFVHFDKTIYTNYENVWFAGYLLTNDSNTSARNTLSVALIRNEDRSIWAEDKFVMRNGLASGNLFLPDSIPPGNYCFLAYTNLITNGYPHDKFVQPVTIKTTDPGFSASVQLLDSIDRGTDSVRMQINTYLLDHHFLPNIPINYTTGNESHPSSPGKIKTNKYGEAVIMIPVKELRADNNAVHIQAKYKNLYRDLNIKLPVCHKEPVVHFYPEGGSMVDATPGYIGWEVKNAEGQPLETSGILYRDRQIIDTIQTNSYGLGKFLLVPEKGNEYYVRVLYKYSNDTVYRLPGILPVSPSITVGKAVTDDTLQFEIHNAQCAGDQLFVLLHDYRKISLVSTIHPKQSHYLIKIPLADLPKGVCTLTLLDSTARPLAERLFFAHIGNRTAIDIHTDTSLYFTRQQVQVSIKLLRPDAKRVTGIASVACVEDSRIEPGKMNDIESYAYLNSELKDLPFKHAALINSETTEYLEDILLIKGWRRYTWASMMQTKAKDVLPDPQSFIFDGRVTRNNKPVKMPMELSMIADSSLYTIQTDSTGGFKIAPEYIVERPEKMVTFFLNKANSGFRIDILDPFHKLNGWLASQSIVGNNDVPSGSESSENLVLKSDEYAKSLEVVTVTVKNKREVFAFGNPIFNKDDCDDYVCLFGVLNCPNHPHGSAGEKKPVAGSQYRLPDGHLFIYEGNCNTQNKNDHEESVTIIRGIYMAKEFYAPDYSKFDPPSPEYLSTIYWNPELKLNSDQEIKISFYTSDISGRFRIVAQGLIPDDVIFGEYVFTVQKKPGH